MAGRGRGRTVPAWMKDGEDANQPPMMSLPKGPAKPTPREEGSLPLGWKEALTPDQRKYWYNVDTGETTWNKPSAEMAPAPQPQPAREAVGSGIGPVAASAQEAPQETWNEYSTEDGRTYYHNPVSGETRWENPARSRKVSADPVRPTKSRSRWEQPAAQQPAVDAGVPDRRGQQWNQQPSQAHSAPRAVAPSTPVAAPVAPAAAPAASQVPPEENWIEYKTGDGRPYYHNPVTNETRWEMPAKPGDEQSREKESAAAEQEPEDQGSEWKEYETQDGRKYYHNVSTGITQWTKPGEGEPKQQRSDVAQKTAKEPRSEAAKPSRRRGGVQRPRDEKGRPLQDKKAELFFVADAEKRRARKASLMEGINRTELTHVEKTQLFKKMLAENGITSESRWLETMKICSADPRYLIFPKYGPRHNAYVIYIAQAKRKDRIEKVLRARRNADDFMAMLEEHLRHESDRARSLEDCSPTASRAVENDPRYKAIEDSHERRSMIRSFFIEKEKLAREASKRKRKEDMAAFRAVLDKLSSGPNAKFHDRTSYREVAGVLKDDEAYKTLEEGDRSHVYESWQKDLEAEALEARSKEKEKRRAEERERRAAFRKGVEELVMAGKIDLMEKWKTAQVIISEQEWFQSMKGQNFKASDLYADVIEAVEEKMMGYKETFKSIAKKADFAIQHDSEFDDFWAKAGELCAEAKLNKVFAMELFRIQVEKALSAKKKEEKRLLRIKEDFWDLLRRKDFGAQSKWEEAYPVVSSRSAYKDLLAFGGEKVAVGAFDEYVLHRKEKEERRKKRHRDAEGGPAGHAAENGDPKRVKVLDEEKLDELQKRKLEILSKLGAGEGGEGDFVEEGEV